MTLTLPNDIINDTPADAVQVEQNYNVIEDYINHELIHRDGSVAMAGQLLLVGDPTQPLQAAAKQYVDAVLPVGIILPFGGLVSPAGKWALCNGASLQQSAYPQLFSVLGTRYGTAAAGQFLLPNLQGRLPIGVDPTQTRFDSSGKTGGTWIVPVPQHNHPMPHTHEHPHTHPIPHTHPVDPPSTNSSTFPGFNMSVKFLNVHNPGSGAAYSALVIWTSPTVSGTTVVNDAEQGSHAHATNIAPFNTGASSAANSGAVSEATTGQPSAANTSNTGTASAEHLPPYQTVVYIIRID